MEKNNSLIKRLLAVLALAAAVVLVFSVVSANTGEDEPANNGNKAAKNQQANKTKNKKPTQATYEVQEGDTLTGIAQETGVSVAKIQRLNPELDPQALQAGQDLKLR